MGRYILKVGLPETIRFDLVLFFMFYVYCRYSALELSWKLLYKKKAGKSMPASVID